MFSETYLKELSSTIVQNVLQELQEQKDQAQPEPKDEVLLTRQQTAEILGISLPTLTDYVKRGIIPAYAVGSRVRFKRSEVIDDIKRIELTKYKRAS